MRNATTILLAVMFLSAPVVSLAQTKPVFRPVQGQRVEVYWLRQWWSATARDVREDQVLIRNDQRGQLEDWVPLDSVRKFTKAAKYPMPATNDEIQAQTQLEQDRLRDRVHSSTPRLPARPGLPGRPGDFADAPLSAIDMSSVNRLADNPDVVIKPLTPDAEPEPKSVATRPMSLSGNPKADSTHSQSPTPAGLFAAPGAGQVCALSTNLGSRPLKLLQRFDVATGTASPVQAIESSMTVNAISPDGKRLVGTNTTRKGYFAEPAAVEVWSLEEKEPKLLVAFPSTSDEHEGHFLELARFVDSDHVLTLTLGKVTCWEVPAAKAVYTRDIGRGTEIAVSATGKYLAAASDRAVRLFDSATGASLGHLPPADPPIAASHVAFSPSGKRLLVSEMQRTVVYDLTRPSVVADIALPMPLTGGVFLSDDYLLVDGRYVVDVAKGAVLWDYDHGGGPFRAFAGRLWYLSRPKTPNTPSVYSAVLPTDEAVKAVGSVAPADLYAVQPGTKVAIALDTGLSGEDQAKAVEAVRAAAARAGWVLADDASIRLVATHAAGESKEIQYEMFMTHEVRKVSASSHTYTVKLEQDGKTLWQTGYTNSPSLFVHPKKDQSIEQHLDEERERLATAFFTGVRLPRYVAKPTDHPGSGTTTLPGATSLSTGQPANQGVQPKRLPQRRPAVRSGGNI